MIFIKLAAQKAADFSIDGEHIDWVGVPFSYDAKNPDDRAELVRHNRGIWRIGKRAQEERYIAFTFNSKVVAVAEISSIKTSQVDDKRLYFVCESLGSGSAVYDKWIGESQPAALRSRNPISYWDDFEIENTETWSWRKDGDVFALIDEIAGESGSREKFITVLESAKASNHRSGSQQSVDCQYDRS